jgi:hypothetical protein
LCSLGKSSNRKIDFPASHGWLPEGMCRCFPYLSYWCLAGNEGMIHNSYQ